MNMRQDRDLAIRFDAICRKLRESGVDLSQIRLSMSENAKPSYITKRIMDEIGKEARND